MQRRKFLTQTSVAVAFGALAAAGCTTTPPASQSANPAAADYGKRRQIDSAVSSTMARLYGTVPGSRELVAKSRGVLVFPSVLQAGFVVGAQYGEGALRVHGETTGYYSTVSGSFGAQIGAQSKAIIFLFMTEDSLRSFRASEGWAVGGDASVALVNIGANGAVDSNTATKPVEVFVLTNTGLMGDLSLAGTKVSRLHI